jgi:predicted class III extradiol MEMO1 family dioxygenase
LSVLFRPGTLSGTPGDFAPELVGMLSGIGKLKIEDQSLIDSLEVAEADNFFKKIADIGDSRKICGLSPIYSLLKLCQPKSGKLLQYKQWNEVETKSAVTIASMSFSNE